MRRGEEDVSRRKRSKRTNSKGESGVYFEIFIIFTFVRVFCFLSLVLSLGLLEEDAVEGVLEPLHGLLLGDLLVVANAAGTPATSGDAGTGATEDDVEVHAVDADVGVVLDAEIDVLVNTEAEAARVGEAALLREKKIRI